MINTEDAREAAINTMALNNVMHDMVKQYFSYIGKARNYFAKMEFFIPWNMIETSEGHESSHIKIWFQNNIRCTYLE